MSRQLDLNGRRYWILSEPHGAEWKAMVARWTSWGATHVSVDTMGAGLKTPQDHIAAIRRFKAVVGA